MTEPSLHEVALTEQTEMFKKLNTLTGSEWAELTAWMSSRFQTEIEARGVGLYFKSDIERMERALDRANRALRRG